MLGLEVDMIWDMGLIWAKRSILKINFRTEKSEKMTVEENARLAASIADAISVQKQFFHNQFTEANAHSEKVCLHTNFIVLLSVLLRC